MIGMSALAVAGPMKGNLPEGVASTVGAKATGTGFNVTGTQTVAPAGSCSRVDITVTGEITGTVDDGGGLDHFWVSIWDDGVMVASRELTVAVGTTEPFSAAVGFEGLYATGVSGVAVVVGEVEGSSSLYSIDPFVPTDIPGSCGPTATFTNVNVPAGSPLQLLLLGLALAGVAVFAVRKH